MMTITCSILCYNYGRFLAQAIESCLSQQQPWCSLEVLVIDDGSTDETAEVCERYRTSIRVIRSANQGFGRSLDRAITQASGEYVCLLDADDYFLPNKIATLRPWVEKEFYYIANRVLLHRQKPRSTTPEVGGVGSTSTLCLHRKAAMTLCPVENEIFFSALNAAGRGAVIEEPLTCYRIHNRSMMRRNGRAAWYRQLAKVTRALSQRLNDLTRDPPFWCQSSLLKQLARSFHSVACYNEMEAELLAGTWLRALRQIPPLLWYARGSVTSQDFWHLRVVARCLRNVPIECETE